MKVIHPKWNNNKQNTFLSGGGLKIPIICSAVDIFTAYQQQDQNTSETQCCYYIPYSTDTVHMYICSVLVLVLCQHISVNPFVFARYPAVYSRNVLCRWWRSGLATGSLCFPHQTLCLSRGSSQAGQWQANGGAWRGQMDLHRSQHLPLFTLTYAQKTKRDKQRIDFFTFYPVALFLSVMRECVCERQPLSGTHTY